VLITCCRGLITNRLPRDRAKVLGISERQNWNEDERKEDQADAKTGTLAEHLGKVQQNNDANDHIDDRNEHQQQPPPGSANDLEFDQDIVNRDDHCPTRFSSFDKNTP